MSDLADRNAAFPYLGSHRVTSDSSTEYNCIAWVLHDTKQYWTPEYRSRRIRGYYWPPGISDDWSIESLIEVFSLHQYQECDDSRLEPDSEKIVIYADANGVPEHVARQLPTGVWTSKLGDEEDIEHATPQSLEGGEYGSIVKIMKRRRG